MINKNSFTYCCLPSNSYSINRDLLVLTDTVHWMRGTPRQSRGPQRTWSSTLGPLGVNDFVPQLPTGASHFSAMDIGGQPKGLLQAQIHENFTTHWWHNLYEWEILRSIFPHSNKLFNAIFFQAHKCIIAIWHTKSFWHQFSLHPITLQATLTPDPTEQSPKQKTPPKSLILLPHPSQCNTSSQSAGSVYVNELIL